ncbi:hypothetical protein PR048_016350 [Dryococelus australis]|uniref:Uncharacterized protein n=1 Tax=Dryococelus australis TaxID=614101 RepID=A0ABQ9HJH7_9NEOP|nr:hypothetical protein PR048_016350 [Dryococelus australis]
MWTELLGPDSRGTYTAVLGVDKADVLDEGTFTCQAMDLGFQQCLSISLDVLKKPQVIILPRSLTVEKVQTQGQLLI